MPSPTLVITIGDEEFPLANPTMQECLEVERWAGYPSRPAWLTAIQNEETKALLAAYGIAKRRKGEPFDFNSTDFVNEPTAKYVRAGREVELVLDKNADDSLKLDSEGNAIPVLDSDGHPQWRDVESGAVIPFGETDTETTSSTPPEPTNSGDSGTGTEATASN